MQNELRKRIISLIKSKDLREHLLSLGENVPDQVLLETICAAPVHLEEKRKLLGLFAGDEEVERKRREKAKETAAALKKALHRLNHMEEGDILMLEGHLFCSVRGLYINIPQSGYSSHSHIFTSLDEALKYMARECFWNLEDQMEDFDWEYGQAKKLHPEEDWEAREKAWVIPPDWYWEVFLIDFDDDVKYGIMEYHFVFTPQGEPQYVNVGHAEPSALYILSGKVQERYNPPVPYQPGDVLRINCFPYAPAADYFCLVLENGPLTCLYPTLSGKVGTGEVAKGYYYENETHMKQYLSPLFCAERHTGELPENCSWMKPISEKLRKCPELGCTIGEAINEEYPWCADRYDEEEWQITQEELFKIAGVDVLPEQQP